MIALRRLKNLRKTLMRFGFEIGQRFGVDILPRHFYSEIPDIRTLKSTETWRTPRSMFGVRGEIETQVRWVEQCIEPYRDKIGKFQVHKNALRMNESDQGFGEIEADFLYCFVRSIRPQRIVQIGCGVSTAICLMAATDEGYAPHITCIEPYPTEFLRRENSAGRLNLLPAKFEEVGPECCSSLKARDLFFVDSSHTLAPAGEVNQIVLEALPRIAAGAYIHFHDIHFPFDYSSQILSSTLFFQHETALLYAFLLMNDHFEIAASLSMLHHMRLNDLVRFFPAMQPRLFDQGIGLTAGHFPSSIYLRKLD